MTAKAMGRITHAENSLDTYERSSDDAFHRPRASEVHAGGSVTRPHQPQTCAPPDQGYQGFGCSPLDKTGGHGGKQKEAETRQERRNGDGSMGKEPRQECLGRGRRPDPEVVWGAAFTEHGMAS